MRAVDTNVLVRLIVRDNPKQVEAAEAFIAPGAWIPLLVLAEAMWVLDSVYALAPHEVITALEILLDHQQLVLEDPEVVVAAVERFEKKPALGFFDCLVVEVTRGAGHLPLGSFDRDLAKIDGAQKL
jgi:predicted nucleic-acid-binding protein